MITVGIDVGSITTKAVLLKGDQWQSLMLPTGWSPRDTGQSAFEQIVANSNLTRDDISYVVGTGYGRISLPFIDKAITEITCHARGAQHLVNGTDMVIDIGGQDSKVILIDEEGNVVNFVMNDKCAAGTGRFLQVMAAVLGADVSELADLAKDAEPVQISSMCTVFAESEVVSLLAQGIPKERIIAGIHRSVAGRVVSMAERLGRGERITFTGGVARNDGVRAFLAKELGREVTVAPEPELAGALGAALLARDRAANR